MFGNNKFYVTVVKPHYQTKQKLVSFSFLPEYDQTPILLLVICYYLIQHILGWIPLLELILLFLIGPKICIEQTQNGNKQVEGLWLSLHISTAMVTNIKQVY